MLQFKTGLKRKLKRKFKTHFKKLEAVLALFERTLPHVKLSKWYENASVHGARASLRQHSQNKKIGIEVPYKEAGDKSKLSLFSEIKKKRAFSEYEREYLNSAASVTAAVIKEFNGESGEEESADIPFASANELSDKIVSTFLYKQTGLKNRQLLDEVLEFLKSLALRSYETHPISYGVLIHTSDEDAPTTKSAKFPADIVGEKRFQSLTDGYQTALNLGANGEIRELVVLRSKEMPGKHYRPTWLDPLAETALKRNALGIALSRTGAILVVWKGNLILTYRSGGWLLWNHNENFAIIRDTIQTITGPQSQAVSKLAAKLYRCALDISFQRSGGLFVILTNANENLLKIISSREKLMGKGRSKGDKAIGKWIQNRGVIGLDREILTDLAALDGAVVVDRSGKILTYGAVLNTPKKGLSKIHGSRSRAAHSASNYGISIKISSDGDIEVKRKRTQILSTST